MPDAQKAKEQILAGLLQGPQIPSALQRSMQPKVESYLVGALLSELEEAKRIKHTHLKIGSSSVYYLPGQEEQLQTYADRLKGPEKEAYTLLADKKLLAAQTLSPSIRVGLDAIKDFSRKIAITYEGKEHIFFRWYLLDDEQTRELVKEFLQGRQKEPTPVDASSVEQAHRDDETVQQERKILEHSQQDAPVHETDAADDEELQAQDSSLDTVSSPQEDAHEKQPTSPKKQEDEEKPAARSPEQNVSKPEGQSASPLMNKLKAKGMTITHYKMINKKDMLFEGTLATSFGPLLCHAVLKKKKVSDADLLECMQYKQGVLIVLCTGASKKAQKNAQQHGILLEEL